MLEADDVVLMQTSVDLDLRHKLLLSSCLCKSGLSNYLGSRYSLVLEVGELKAPGKSSFTEELALQISLNANISVVFDHFLFDDSLGLVKTCISI